MKGHIDQDVEKLVSKIFGDMHSKRQHSITNATLGVISSNSLITHRIGIGLAESQDLLEKHAIKQVDRLLSNDKLESHACSGKLAQYIIGSRKEIVVAMDWTDFDADNQATIQINLVTSHGRATPLIWKTVSKNDLKDKRNEYEDALLNRLREIVSEDVKVTVLADRGFGDTKLYDLLKHGLHFNYVIRFRGNIKVTSTDGETRSAVDWVGPGGKAKKLNNAKVTALECVVPAVVCVKAANMKQAWCIASSNSELSASKLIQWYAKRWGIEPQFRDTKDLHFGMGLNSTRISKPERRDRLLMIGVIAILILTLLGATGERLGMDRYLKVNTVKHRTMSLFRQGCCYFRRIKNMAISERKKFVNCFLQLLTEHTQLQEVLWLI